jgi:CheY-like chemotaxis protein
LNRIVRSQLKLLTELAGSSEVVATLEADSLPVAIDPARFEQVLLNLVGNARDAIDGAGRIELRLAKNADRALLEVRDNGTGMTAQVRAKAFDPFFTTKVPDRGTGLGLAIIKDTVADCGGTIEVESEPGKGTTFRLLLPLATRTVPTELPHDRPVGTEIVLLAEDDDAVRLVIARGLRRLGYTVFEAANGEQALSVSRRHKGPIDLLLTDGNMPRMNGVDLARAFAQERPDAARIMITGDSMTAPEDLFLTVISKPVRLQPLADQVRELLDARAAPTAN